MIKTKYEGREITLGFDYGSLAAEDRDFVIAATIKIHFYTSVAASAVATAGGCLREVKERLPEGQWCQWIATEFELSERTVQRWMAIHAMAVSRTADFATLDNFELKALYLLTQNVVSDGIRDAAFRHVLDGQKVTHKMVSEMVGVAYGKPRPAAPPIAPPAPAGFDPNRDWTKPGAPVPDGLVQARHGHADYSGHDVEDDDDAPRARPVGAAPPPATPHALTELLALLEGLVRRPPADVVSTIHPKFATATASRVAAASEWLDEVEELLRDKAVKVAA